MAIPEKDEQRTPGKEMSPRAKAIIVTLWGDYLKRNYLP